MAFQINLQHPQLRRYKLRVIWTLGTLTQITQVELIWLVHPCDELPELDLPLEVPLLLR